MFSVNKFFDRVIIGRRKFDTGSTCDVNNIITISEVL